MSGSSFSYLTVWVYKEVQYVVLKWCAKKITVGKMNYKMVN